MQKRLVLFNTIVFNAKETVTHLEVAMGQALLLFPLLLLAELFNKVMESNHRSSFKETTVYI